MEGAQHGTRNTMSLTHRCFEEVLFWGSGNLATVCEQQRSFMRPLNWRAKLQWAHRDSIFRDGEPLVNHWTIRRYSTVKYFHLARYYGNLFHILQVCDVLIWFKKCIVLICFIFCFYSIFCFFSSYSTVLAHQARCNTLGQDLSAAARLLRRAPSQALPLQR